MIDLQLGRRNISQDYQAYSTGTRYSEEKQCPKFRGNQFEVSAHSEHLKTCDKLAKEYGVGQGYEN